MKDPRVEEHRNLGIAFCKTGLLGEAAREFHPVAELRAKVADAPVFTGLVGLKQARWRQAQRELGNDEVQSEGKMGGLESRKLVLDVIAGGKTKVHPMEGAATQVEIGLANVAKDNLVPEI